MPSIDIVGPVAMQKRDDAVNIAQMARIPR